MCYYTLYLCVQEFCICVLMCCVFVCVFALPLWPPLSCRVLPTCWLSRPNEQSLLRIGFISMLAQSICVSSFLYLCIHVLCICVFADWEKLTSSHSYEWASKASSLNPNYLCFSKSIVLRVYSFSRTMFTRTILALAGTFCWHRMHVRSNCAFTFFQHICQEFSGQLLNSQTFWSCLFVKRFVFLCTDFLNGGKVTSLIDEYPWHFQESTQTRKVYCEKSQNVLFLKKKKSATNVLWICFGV